jgi:translation elongation factor EF-G
LLRERSLIPAVEQLRAENQKLKSVLAQESMNAREAILKIQNTTEELRQSLAKAEYDRENMRNYVASKEVQNEELKKQLGKEIAERKRLAEQAQSRSVEEEIVPSSVQEYDAVNQTRTDLDEVGNDIIAIGCHLVM